MKKRLITVKNGVVVEGRNTRGIPWKQIDSTVYKTPEAAQEAHPTAKFRGEVAG